MVLLNRVGQCSISAAAAQPDGPGARPDGPDAQPNGPDAQTDGPAAGWSGSAAAHSANAYSACQPFAFGRAAPPCLEGLVDQIVAYCDAENPDFSAAVSRVAMWTST